jgi:biotin carboxylase
LVAATTGYQTRAFAEAARDLEIELILATDRCHVLEDPWGDHAIALKFDQPEESAAALAGLRVDGVVGLGDRQAWIAALAAQKLGVPFHPADAAMTAIDKNLARQSMAGARLPVPEYYVVPAGDIPSAARFYPCVLKPLGLSASRGVIRADDDAGFRQAFLRIRAILDRPEIRRLKQDRDNFIQIEQYIEGREFALEGIVDKGSLKVLALFDKPDPLVGPFFEETIYVTPSRESPAIQQELESAARRAVAALGLSHGPVHAEMRLLVDGGQTRVFVLEVAPRPIGGLCARALRFPGKVGLEELVLRHAVGLPLRFSPADPAAVMMIPIPRGGVYQGVSGVSRALSIPDVDELIITAKIGQELVPLPEGASYLGFIFGRGPGAEHAIRAAHACLEFEISRTLPISH